MSGTLFIVAAPSGAGKTSLVKALLEREPGITLSVSYTSRAPRPGEEDGKHYHFVNRAVFERMVATGQFYESANVHGDYKGTSRAAVEPVLAAGGDVLLEIDWQGAQQVRALCPEALSIFILPPSRAELERRLRNRASDGEEQIKRRLADSRTEIARAGDFDYLVINDDFATALADIRGIVHSQRLRTDVQMARHRSLLNDLLKPE